MNSNKSIARIIGILFITATVTTSLSLILSGPILEAPDNLTIISANKTKVIIAMLLMLTDAIAVAGIAIVMHPILKKQNVVLALGYVGSRIIESVLFIVYIIILLTLLTLSQEFVKTGISDTSYFKFESTLLLAASDWTFSIAYGFIFTLSALILNYSLFQSKIVPRWISVWGIVGAYLSFALVLLKFFNIHLTEVLDFPIAIQEMVFAIWLIVKGFDSSTIASKATETIN